MQHRSSQYGVAEAHPGEESSGGDDEDPPLHRGGGGVHGLVLYGDGPETR